MTDSAPTVVIALLISARARQGAPVTLSRSDSRVDYNLEFGHLYVEEMAQVSLVEFLHAEIDIVHGLIAQLRRDGKTFSVCCLVDDYERDVDRQWAVDRVFSEFGAVGIDVDYVAFERDAANVAPTLLSELQGRALERQAQITRFVRSTSRSDLKVVLAEPWEGETDRTYYNCSALAACWELARLGVEPFLGAMAPTARADRPVPAFPGSALLTVLPAKYIGVESTVLDIIGSLQHRTVRKLRDSVGLVLY